MPLSAAMLIPCLIVPAWIAEAAPDTSSLPVVRVSTDNTQITRSCRIVIAPDTVVCDTDDNGVLQVVASNIEIEFSEGSQLRGAPRDAAPNTYAGCGIRIHGQTHVTIRGARISGFRCGLWATKADGLVLHGIDASDNRRARLKSTPLAEDGGDWLFGHNNDRHEWLTNYGAAFYIEEAAQVTVRNCRVRHGQNALCLDRITQSSIYDNDFSFNSGWGLALWRCTRNTVSRNAMDFCVRGYSHGVYNRGQDSAGIFAFEQNCENVFAENSATHGGDGFFGFAGREAIAETGEHPVDWYKRRGNSDNLLVANDFSYAAAHGIENTFSFGNRYLANRIVENAICGIWAGYSRETLIAGNQFEGNGEMGYGLERGGVNIDHGGDNQILRNTFTRNKCGVHLWGGTNADFEKKRWAQANGYASVGSVIAGNTFDRDDLAFHFRGPGDATLAANTLQNVKREMICEAGYKATRNDQLSVAPFEIPAYKVLGDNRPVGARASLQGRRNIIMTEWGPWDHESPLVRQTSSRGRTVTYEVHKVPVAEVGIEVAGQHVQGVVEPLPGSTDACRITVSALEDGLHAYKLKVLRGRSGLAELSGSLLAARWDVTFFKWPKEIDPRERLDDYRKLAEGPTAVKTNADQLSFRYGMRGPGDIDIASAITSAAFGSDRFGMVARTRLPLSKGTWKISMLSDDGVRVVADGRTVVDNWTWHGPTTNEGELNLASDKVIELTVEHFEIDGFAVLDFAITAK
jgi:nitrous oxidase accessory protein NosD